MSDTHVPVTASDLPKQIYEEIGKVDMIIHAGDFIDMKLLERLKSLKEVKAVAGNMDPKEIQNELKQKEILKIAGLKIGLIHGYGAPAELLERVKKEFEGVDAVIFGHSHTAMNMKKDGVLYFNPGSPTDKIFASKNSYGILNINGKKIEGEIIDI